MMKRHSFDTAANVTPATRKAFFDAIRADDAQAVAATLGQYPSAIYWQEPFADNEKPFAKDNTPLMTAAESRKVNSGLALIEHGACATMDQQNSRGWTALMFASWHGVQPIAEKLLWAGANSHLQNEGGQDAVIMASLRDHTHIKRMIESHRHQTDGAAAFTNGTTKSTCVLSTIKLRK